MSALRCVLGVDAILPYATRPVRINPPPRKRVAETHHLARDAHSEKEKTPIATMASTAAGIATTTSSDIPLWALICVVIGGTVILVTSVVFPLLFYQRWRWRRRRASRKRTVLVDGEAVSVYHGSSDGGSGEGGTWGRDDRRRSGGPRKLRKRNRDPEMSLVSESSDGLSDGEVDGGRLSPVSTGAGRGRQASRPPVLPALFGGRKLSPGLFSVRSGRTSLVSLKSVSDRMSGAVGAAAGFIPPRPGNHRRTTSSTWLDEDALHGPAMNVSPGKGKGKEALASGAGTVRSRMGRSWRRSFRESWPLKTISPTLPKLAQFSTSPRVASHEAFFGDMQQPPPVPPHGSGGGGVGTRFQTNQLALHHAAELAAPEFPAETQYSPPRQLPKPPRQALLAASAEVAGRAHERSSSWNGPKSAGSVPQSRGSSYYVYEDGERRAMTPSESSRLSTGARRSRPSSSGSTLTEILRGTERRLQAQRGVTKTGRNSAGSSPSRRSLAPSAMERTRPGSLPIDVGNGSSSTLIGTTTPSPGPLRPFRPYHSRGDSQSSIASEIDSLLLRLSDPSAGLGAYQSLASPGTGGGLSSLQQQLVRRSSSRSSMVSSIADASDDGQDRSLSTIEDLDETADETRTTSPPGTGNRSADMDKMAGLRSESSRSADDPFVSLRGTSPMTNERVASWGPARPVSRGGPHAFKDAPRLQDGAFFRAEVTLQSLRSESPLSVISANSRISPEPRPHRFSPDNRGYRAQTPQSGRSSAQDAVYLTAPTSAVSSTATLHRRSLSTVHDDEEEDGEGTPVPCISLTSPGEKDKASPGATRLSDLRVQASSPTLGRSRDRTPDMPPPSQALPRSTVAHLSSFYDSYADGPSSSSDALSRSSSTANRREGRKVPDSSSSAAATGKELQKVDALGELTMLFHGDDSGARRKVRPLSTSTVRLVPPEDARLPQTIAQLRRMNSQLSASSNAASGYSEASSTAAVLPTLREETGKFVSPPRQKEARRNYLAVGTSPPKHVTGESKYSGNHNDKENERIGDVGVKLSKVEIGGEKGSPSRQGVERTFGTPARTIHLRVGERSPERKSEESLGLYDADGFWVSPERRTSRRF